MWRYFKLLCSLLFVITIVNQSYAAKIHPSLDPFVDPTLGQADMANPLRPNDHVYIDWIVVMQDITLGIVPDSDIRFADILGYFDDPSLDIDGTSDGKKGTIDLFRDGSVYYYFYQLENFTSNYATGFTLNLDPDTVLTAGFIYGNYDLDTGLLVNHNLAGENEPTGGKSPIISSTFDPSGTAPNISLSFINGGGGLAPQRESWIFFVTCLAPPRYEINSLIAGSPPLFDELPIPTAPVAEPMSMILFGSFLTGLAVWKKRR